MPGGGGVGGTSLTIASKPAGQWDLAWIMPDNAAPGRSGIGPGSSS